MSYRTLACLVVGLVAATAQAMPIAVATVAVVPNFGDNVITQTSPGLASDGNLNTGYVVTSTPGSNPNQLIGFAVRWDYDLSSLGPVSSFTFSFAGVLTDPSSLHKLRIGASPFSNFAQLTAPNGQLVSTSLTMTSSGSNALDLDNYIHGNTLSVYLQTEFGTGTASLGSISLDMREISADITADPLTPPTHGLPEPASLALALGALAMAAGSRRR